MEIFTKPRNSVMNFNEVYFWTATLSKWRHLLAEDKYKQVIVDSLNYLSERDKIKVCAFVIMPNHIHLIWEILQANGKEAPYESFLKYTAHQFQKILKASKTMEYNLYDVDEITRKQRYWKRDPLAIKILSREMAQQKLEYIHNNPLQEHWNLTKEPEQYYYSSAFDYLNNFTRFKFLCHYFDRV
jgi:REP element-mobilizing transposase RayT